IQRNEGVFHPESLHRLIAEIEQHAGIGRERLSEHQTALLLGPSGRHLDGEASGAFRRFDDQRGLRQSRLRPQNFGGKGAGGEPEGEEEGENSAHGCELTRNASASKGYALNQSQASRTTISAAS